MHYILTVALRELGTNGSRNSHLRDIIVQLLHILSLTFALHGYK